MGQYNEQQAGPSWVNQMDANWKFEQAVSRLPPGKQNANKRNKNQNASKPKNPQPSEQISTAETAPRDDLMYDGYFTGSKPVRSDFSHNLDFSSFPLLCERVWLSMETEDGRLRRQMPYCLFLHTMVEYLTAYLITVTKFQNADSRFEGFTDPLKSMRASSYLIPKPIYEYIVSIGKAVTSTGTTVKFNYPTAGTPRGPQTDPDVASGTFGPCTDVTHNAYECYVSPYITRSLIERTLYANTTTTKKRFDDWEPLPPSYYPPNSTPNQNLLGYQKPERLNPDGIEKLRNLNFYNDDTPLGWICHCDEVVARVSGVLGTLSREFDIVAADFHAKTNSAAFIYVEHTDSLLPVQRLAQYSAKLLSPESFGSGAANKANYFTFKRKRDSASSGPCYTMNVNGGAPAGWIETRNNNFDMSTGTGFDPLIGLQDFSILRHPLYVEDTVVGDRGADITQWLQRHFREKKKSFS